MSNQPKENCSVVMKGFNGFFNKNVSFIMDALKDFYDKNKNQVFDVRAFKNFMEPKFAEAGYREGFATQPETRKKMGGYYINLDGIGFR